MPAVLDYAFPQRKRAATKANARVRIASDRDERAIGVAGRSGKGTLQPKPRQLVADLGVIGSKWVTKVIEPKLTAGLVIGFPPVAAGTTIESCHSGIGSAMPLICVTRKGF